MRTAEEFWLRTEVVGECLEWQGATNSTGYGSLQWEDTHATAHRVAAMLCGLVDSIHVPTDRTQKVLVCHTCDNPKCCNPNHFFIGSTADNLQDAYNKGRKVQPRGVRHANAKLTASQVREIRRGYSHGERQVDLATQYGVSQRAISLLVRGETYTNV